jgi:hypothetical protein
MSNAASLHLGPSLPMTDKLVDMGPVEQHAPSTSSQSCLALPSQWICSDIRRYTQQGAAFRVLNIVPPTALAPPTLKLERVPISVLRTDKNNHRLPNPPSPGAARHTAPHRASGRSLSPSKATKLKPHQARSCAANTCNPPRPHFEATLPTHSPNVTTNPPQYVGRWMQLGRVGMRLVARAGGASRAERETCRGGGPLSTPNGRLLASVSKCLSWGCVRRGCRVGLGRAVAVGGRLRRSRRGKGSRPCRGVVASHAIARFGGSAS